MEPLVLTNPIYLNRDDCGYCHGKKPVKYSTNYMKTRDVSSTTIATNAEIMTCQDYDDFINMGFRRSGTMLYKTDMLRNCCRYYTIRTNLEMMTPQKKHRQVINRFVKAIGGESNSGGKFDINCLIEAELKSNRFRTRFEPSVFTQEKFNLYKKYQVHVHNDNPKDITKSLFDRFLCENPFPDHEQEGTFEEWQSLADWKISGKPKAKRLGPTHECYYLDDKLIAISIMDFLPSGISSIYFIWDPDFAHLSLGTLSGLRELLMVRELGLDFYYLGYYIEDCEKMVYKGKFGGELLDLCTETYFPLHDLSEFIKDSKYFVIGDENVHKELPLSFNYPASRSSIKPQSNIVENIYTDSTIKSADELKILFPSGSKLPSVVPGLMPLTQLESGFESFKDIAVTFFNGFTGTIKRQIKFSEMSEKEKTSFIDTLRLLGPKKMDRMIIVIY